MLLNILLYSIEYNLLNQVSSHLTPILLCLKPAYSFPETAFYSIFRQSCARPSDGVGALLRESV